jgi:hypothetical protein
MSSKFLDVEAVTEFRQAHPKSEYVIVEKEIETNEGKKLINLIEPPQKVELTWGLNFKHEYNIAFQLPQEGFVELVKQQILIMQQEIEKRYPEWAFNELRKMKMLDGKTFKPIEKE